MIAVALAAFPTADARIAAISAKLSRATQIGHDALNRVTRIEQPDGSAHVVTYRPDGRKAAETDPRGTTTTYGYDAAGRLTSVTQSGITQATAYAYDQTGAKTVQTDARAGATCSGATTPPEDR